MIAKMTRYDILLMSKDKDAIIKGIRDIGLLDIRHSFKGVDEWSESQIARLERLRYTASCLDKIDYSSDPEYAKIIAISKKYPKFTEGFKEKYDTRATLLTDTESQLAEAEAEIKSLEPWGDFDGAVLTRLEEIGCKVHFYICEAKRFDSSWSGKWPLQEVNRDGKNVWFVIAGDNTDFPLTEIEAPQFDRTVVGLKAKSLREKVTICKASLLAMKNQTQEIKDRYDLVFNELNLYLASNSTSEAAEGAVTVITAFAPAEKNHDIEVALNGMDLYFMSNPAVKEDNPPIHLKNNWFARNFETLTGMYGMPVYDEFDPTPVLAPFFLLFWSFCMGDMGYGIILTAVGILLRKMDILGLKPHWRLVTTLGVGATVIGFFFANFFGIHLNELTWIPEWLRKMMIVGKIEVGAAKYDVTMIAAIAVGVFHISLAMIIKAICRTSRFGIKGAISTWGWVVLIVGGLIVAGLALTSVLSSEVTKIAVIIIGIVAGLSIYIFNTPGRNPLTNIGAGLWNTYEMSTGLLSDVLSYIRLYALGLAGGMLGEAFNDLAGMTLGSNPTWQWVCFILIVVFGHALNFAMACLGAFVHPLRLTFVEYFKNSGYEGRGTKYNPLRTEQQIIN